MQQNLQGIGSTTNSSLFCRVHRDAMFLNILRGLEGSRIIRKISLEAQQKEPRHAGKSSGILRYSIDRRQEKSDIRSHPRSNKSLRVFRIAIRHVSRRNPNTCDNWFSLDPREVQVVHCGCWPLWNEIHNRWIGYSHSLSLRTKWAPHRAAGGPCDNVLHGSVLEDRYDHKWKVAHSSEWACPHGTEQVHSRRNQVEREAHNQLFAPQYDFTDHWSIC